MRAGAIVVGIDKYATPAWELNGAVRDAIAFARWATAAGGVSVGDLTLLLSRSEDSEPVPDELAPAVEQASKAAINAVLSSFKVKNAGDGLDRLWFFYAGHGLSAPGETPAAGPLLVPADVDDIDVYLSEGPIGVESFRNAMQDQPPREQIYLVDACRDALPLQGNKLPTQGYFWDVARIKNDMLATQGVLLATTAGQRAKEIRGRGAFSKVLLSGLKGLGPDLDAPPSPAPGQRPRPCVGFDKLVDFVKYALERELGDKDLQVPYGTLNKIGARLSIADFAPNDLPRAKITFIVRPGDARPTGKLHFLLWSEQDWDWIPRDRNPAPCGPPLQEEVSVTITGGTHYVQVLANGFDAFNMPLRVYDDRRFPVELQPATTFERKSMLESVAAPAPATNATHSLTVEASDRLARVCIVDPAGRELARDYHTVTRTGLVPGMYRIVAELAGRDRVEKKVQVPTDRQIVGLDLTAPAPNPQVVDSLHMAGIGVGAFSEPSEAFGRIAGARLSSMLAYAAWGARWPDGSHFYKLRQLGVDRLATLKPTDSALQVIVADTQPGDAPAVLVERENDGAPNRKLQLPLAPLTGLPMASQASLATRPGGVFVSVSMPGSLSATVATCLIPGFVTVLIVSREDDGPVELQQYFNPIDPQVPVAPGFDPPRPDDVRLVELSWRALEARDPLDSIEYGGLLQGKRSNPLLGLIAGYRMLGTPAADEFLGPLEDRHAVASAGKSPLWNMLSLFADLPDVHVLAALYDTPNRDEHFARAAAKGTPLLALGFASLVDWMTERAVKARELPPEIAHTQLPGVPWTAWTSLPSTVSDVEVFRVVTASGRRYRERSALAKIASGAQRVGMLRAGDTTASCFAISNSRVLCPGSAIRSVTKLGDSGPVVRFQGLQGPASFVHAVQSMPVAGLPESDWPWLLTIDPIAPVPEIVLAASMPAPSAGLAVVGYASSQIVIPPALWAHFETIDGIRQALLGKALVSAAPRLRYECYVAAGVEGGLVLDVDLGHVLGVHVGPLEDGRTGGFGIDAASLAATLLESGTGISIAGGS